MTRLGNLLLNVLNLLVTPSSITVLILLIVLFKRTFGLLDLVWLLGNLMCPRQDRATRATETYVRSGQNHQVISTNSLMRLETY